MELTGPISYQFMLTILIGLQMNTIKKKREILLKVVTGVGLKSNYIQMFISVSRHQR
jgi:hypothetical protein